MPKKMKHSELKNPSLRAQDSQRVLVLSMEIHPHVIKLSPDYALDIPVKWHVDLAIPVTL
jgi:hypothetical protein